MKFGTLLITAALPLALTACGNAKEAEAERLGFTDESEMEEVQSKGWHSHAQYVADETERARRFGFTTIDELHQADAAGVKTKAAYDKYVADLDAKNEQFAKEEDAKNSQENVSESNPEAESQSGSGLFSSIFGSSSSGGGQNEPRGGKNVTIDGAAYSAAISVGDDGNGNSKEHYTLNLVKGDVVTVTNSNIRSKDTSSNDVWYLHVMDVTCNQRTPEAKRVVLSIKEKRYGASVRGVFTDVYDNKINLDNCILISRGK